MAGTGTESSGGCGEVDDGGEVDSGQTFIVPSDGGALDECDMWTQNCPQGEKCALYSTSGVHPWDAVKCVPVVEEPAGIGEPCVADEDPMSGLDDCGVGVMCWGMAPGSNEGTCVAMCSGSSESAKCAAGFVCAIRGAWAPNLCLPSCDPLAGDCPDEGVCIANGNRDGFMCFLDGSGEGGQLFDGCEYANACDAGLACLDVEAAVECDTQASGCCGALCDLTVEDACPGAGQVCVPYYPVCHVPGGYEGLGFCSVMPREEHVP